MNRKTEKEAVLSLRADFHFVRIGQADGCRGIDKPFGAENGVMLGCLAGYKHAVAGRSASGTEAEHGLGIRGGVPKTRSLHSRLN